jgi:hypothetical protein
MAQASVVVAGGTGRCSVHGPVQGTPDTRGRLRCPEPSCRKILSIARGKTHLDPRAVVPVELLAPGDLSRDPGIRRLQKDLAKARLGRAIREARKPLEWEAELERVREEGHDHGWRDGWGAGHNEGVQEGYEKGKKAFAIHYYCDVCDSYDLVVEPNSKAHQVVVDALKLKGWGHTTCHEAQR